MPKDTPEPLAFARKGRTWTTLIALVGTWIVLLLIWLVLNAAWWIVLFFLLFTIPAARDIWVGTSAGSDLSRHGLRWYSGAQEVNVSLDDIDHVRLVTRLDTSVRAALVLFSGRKLRMPIESTPPHKDFERALLAHGVKVQRHHFTPL
ncbi:MAG: hypothetical protein AAF754_14945 [Pseudomonadota bacterium]